MEVTVDVKVSKLKVGDKVIAEVTKLHNNSTGLNSRHAIPLEAFALEIKEIIPAGVVRNFRRHGLRKIIVHYQSRTDSIYPRSTILRVIRLL